MCNAIASKIKGLVVHVSLSFGGKLTLDGHLDWIVEDQGGRFFNRKII
jgi:hypothetical protein